MSLKLLRTLGGKNLQNIFPQRYPNPVRNITNVKDYRLPKYEGQASTTGQVINKENRLESHIIIEKYNSLGFRLTNGILVTGPAIFFPRSAIAWNVGTPKDVNEESLVLFTIIDPKPDLIVYGYGEDNWITREDKMRFISFCKKHNLYFEMSNTVNAASIFNFMNEERRYVVGLFIPPNVMVPTEEECLESLTRQEIRILNNPYRNRIPLNNPGK